MNARAVAVCFRSERTLKRPFVVRAQAIQHCKLRSTIWSSSSHSCPRRISPWNRQWTAPPIAHSCADGGCSLQRSFLRRSICRIGTIRQRLGARCLALGSKKSIRTSGLFLLRSAGSFTLLSQCSSAGLMSSCATLQARIRHLRVKEAASPGRVSFRCSLLSWRRFRYRHRPSRRPHSAQLALATQHRLWPHLEVRSIPRRRRSTLRHNRRPQPLTISFHATWNPSQILRHLLQH